MLGNMRDQWEARINAIENIQEKFGHEIREIKKEFSRLARLVEPRTKAKVMHPQEFSPSLTQPFPHFGQHPNPRPSIPIASNKACRPNLRHSLDTPKTVPVHTKASLSSNQSSSLEHHLKGSKAGTDRIRWDPISSSYVKLFSKLMESRLITSIHMSPLKPSFPRWYDANTHCDFHCGNPGHSIENCIALKNRVQDLIQVGLVELEASDEQRKGGSQFSSFFRGKTSVLKQGDEVPTTVKGKTQWDPIPITYTELFPKLIDGGFIVPVHWYIFQAPISQMVQCQFSMPLDRGHFKSISYGKRLLAK